jgi:hypothetical protein
VYSSSITKLREMRYIPTRFGIPRQKVYFTSAKNVNLSFFLICLFLSKWKFINATSFFFFYGQCFKIKITTRKWSTRTRLPNSKILPR